MLNKPTYNERSWAIDLIGHIKYLANKNNRSIKDAGGEQTIKSENGSMFPDVLLFGDHSTARILQGWELKMPDTDINDHEFRKNAEAKARALDLNSFLLWNVSYAHIYIKNVESNEFVIDKEWSELSDIKTRDAVKNNRERWMHLAEKIFGYLNDLFDRGSLEGTPFIEAYKSGGITELMMQNSAVVEEALKQAANKDSTLEAEMVLWWDKNQREYGGESMNSVLGQVVISNWLGKILFAHILCQQDNRARRIGTIDENTTPADALELFRKLSTECNFWTIFTNSIGLSTLPDQAWNDLKQFNKLLSDLSVGSIDQEQLSAILEATTTVATRKVRGQYTTPPELARLLVKLCLRDTVNDRVLDPCSGSGTIARAALETKLSVDIPPNDAVASVLVGDQDPQAVQVATFALAKPNLMHSPLRIFQRDAFKLSPSTEITFQDPNDGIPFTEKLGQFDCIISNLPFVSQNGRKRYSDAIEKVIGFLTRNESSLSRRSDIAAFLPFTLYPLLKSKGILGIIVTNAWLGTGWGDSFYESLSKYYNVKSIIASGSGRWFQNSEVITNILILEKKSEQVETETDIQFVTLNRPIDDLIDDHSIKITAAQINSGKPHKDSMNIRTVSSADLKNYRRLGIGGNAQFVECEWVLNLPLTPLNSLFNIRRGERRGNNSLFYPASGHGIESEYIRPLVKSPEEFTFLVTQAQKEAFSCTRSEQDLADRGDFGALAWINRFRTSSNIQKLASSDIRWYEMRADTLADLVMFINYGERIFVGRVNPPSFVDQRLVRLDPKTELDLDLCHALMNSSIGMFMIEGLGFGRGLGALDLNKDRIEKSMQILDPRQLSKKQADRIKMRFLPLLEREIVNVFDELEQDDRKQLDDTIIEAFDINIDRQSIYESLRTLVGTRVTAND